MLKKLLTRAFSRPIRDGFINGLLAMGFVNKSFRAMMYRLYGIKTETDSIRPGCFFLNPNVKIGKGSVIGDNCIFDNWENVPIEIGENCNIARDVGFLCATHIYNDPQRRAGEIILSPIIVKRGTWIGARATILPGVTIGEGCVIAAGSVVNRNCESNCIYAGVPAKKIKEILSE